MKKSVKIFGILNVTPDSFSDGGLFLDSQKAIIQAENLFKNRANFVDIGGESTKPNAQEITPEVEWKRISEIMTKLLEKFPGKISLDTKNFSTAEKFLNLGGSILNDVSGFQDKNMIEIATKNKCLCIVNHFPGKTTTEVHEQEICSINQVRDELMSKKELMIKEGISSKNIILDPGIGFGKTMELNWELLKFGSVLPKEQILIGHSRKRFLGKNRFNSESNNEAAKIAIEHGAEFLRLHEPNIYE